MQNFASMRALLIYYLHFLDKNDCIGNSARITTLHVDIKCELAVNDIITVFTIRYRTLEFFEQPVNVNQRG